MAVTKEVFGTARSGETIYRYYISNEKGMKAGVLNFGANLVNLYVPDREGKVADITLGFDSLEPYYENESFLGAVIGPNANRTGGASFRLEGVTYQLDVNDGPNNLHSHMEKGYHKRVWQTDVEGNSVTFSLEDEDGSMGFPGNKKISVTYTVTEDNELRLHYHGVSDRNTVLNLTNHAYFNLAGHKAGKIYEHTLVLNASHFTPVAAGGIPTGEIRPVEGGPFDFRKEKKVGRDIQAEDEQLKLVGGYDHNWVIDGADGSLREIAQVWEETSGRRMKVFTTLPGVQFYAGNFIGRQSGKEGAEYGPRSGLCLETQFFPDTANHPEFPSNIFGPDREYDSVTVYQFVDD